MNRFSSKNKGQLSIELIAGLIILIPIVLFLLDVGAVVLANSINDDLAKRSARAAGGQSTAQQALDAASSVVSRTRSNPVITRVQLDPAGFSFDTASGRVSVRTRVDVKLPVPVPGFENLNFRAQAVEPIVALPPI